MQFCTLCRHFEKQLMLQQTVLSLSCATWSALAECFTCQTSIQVKAAFNCIRF